MKSTGEVMGVGVTFAEAFIKSQLAASVKLPASGKAFLSVKDSDKTKAVEIAGNCTMPASNWSRHAVRRRSLVLPACRFRWPIRLPKGVRTLLI
jgi:hypothetical protein